MLATSNKDDMEICKTPLAKQLQAASACLSRALFLLFIYFLVTGSGCLDHLHHLSVKIFHVSDRSSSKLHHVRLFF
jgi:hypothetical protein